MAEDQNINQNQESQEDKFLADENKKRLVTGPDGVQFEVDPMQDYFCDKRPETDAPKNKIVEKFLNWARAESLWVLGFGTGCGSIEIPPLFSPRFDAFRYGVQMRPTPRQSSVIVISGYLSVKTLKRAIRTYEQMQSPKYVLALGSCTINGGMYYDSYNTINRVDYYMPVDIYVAGCMPRPEALLAGFNKLKERIKQGRAEGANEYAEQFDWYKANQKKIIKNWNMPDYNW
ncbi:MAG TPA: NADH-quinone oxidoreductase subunit NuoB [Salinivirga sp.]|uniref:NAD(P)H-quinone oxidoreductase subunit K n=1 Tax=Salinivirga cyanobacteriivorans TaxID=1307839 RepID=A0A0S2I264_9BACT|nr:MULTISPECIES: NADH-quinone oxidoreductase subunit NuoB [Salinivirga]ALO16331.1 NAD(P)H-quinone oxidoreductase subunit K [Salinivirga cyanobacteriivorans]HKK58571.1 NADH-quinone oxidoreductase subunit NuoB [Salinivirga sp.]